MADVRAMKAVGSVARDVSKQMESGYKAQGFALAQTIIAIVISQASVLARAVFTSFELDNKARDEAVKELRDWQKRTAEQAKGNGNLIKSLMDQKQLGKIARSANVRVSEFATIVKAQNAGMNRQTLAKVGRVDDPENMSFHTIVEIARQFNQSSATASVGRPADPLELKLAKWLAAQKVDGHDAEILETVKARLADMLPNPENKARRVEDRAQEIVAA